MIGARGQRQPRHRLREERGAGGVGHAVGFDFARGQAGVGLPLPAICRARAAVASSQAAAVPSVPRRACSSRGPPARPPPAPAPRCRGRCDRAAVPRPGRDSARSAPACTGSARSRGRASRRDRDSSRRRTGTRPGTCSAAPRARCGSRRLRAARAAPRARGGPTPAIRRGTGLRDARAKSRRAADRCRRRPARPRSPCDAARETAACPRSQAKSGRRARRSPRWRAPRLGERGQDAGQALREHRLAGAGRADHQQTVRARRGDHECALGLRPGRGRRPGRAGGRRSAGGSGCAASAANGSRPARCAHTASSDGAG